MRKRNKMDVYQTCLLSNYLSIQNLGKERETIFIQSSVVHVNHFIVRCIFKLQFCNWTAEKEGRGRGGVLQYSKHPHKKQVD